MNSTMADFNTTSSSNSTQTYANDPYTVKAGDDDMIVKVQNDRDVKYMMLKLFDYFNYAILGVDGVDATKQQVEKAGCAQECGSKKWGDSCCASVAMYKSGKDEVSFINTCIDYYVADSNIGMWIDDFYFTVECEQNKEFGSRSSRSSASGLATAGVAASVMLVASTLV